MHDLIAQEKGYALETHQVVLGSTHIPLPENSIDIVYSRLALHYSNPSDTINILNEIYRILKPQGIAFITVKSPDDINEMKFLRETAKEIDTNVFDDAGDIKSRYTHEQWKSFCSNLDFNNVLIGTYVEDLSGKIDKVKSGNSIFTLTELVLTK